MSTIKIISDSTCDLPAKWLQQYDIRIIPAFVNFGEESYADDGVEITRSEFYERMTKDPPTTAAPPPGLAEQVYRDALQEADQLIVLTVAAALSSVHNSLLISARSVDEQRITLIDSGTVSMGLGWQVLAAAEAASQDAALDDILAVIDDTRRHTNTYAILNTLEYLRRSGRVGWATASIASLLNIKPMVSIKDSKVLSLSRVRAFKKAMHHMVDMIAEFAPFERLAILHSNTTERAAILTSLVNDLAPADYTVTVDINTALGTHVGPNAVGLSFVSKG